MDFDPTGEVEITEEGDRLLVRTPEGMVSALVRRRGSDLLISVKGHQHLVSHLGTASVEEKAVESGDLRAQLPSQVVEVLRQPGDEVKKGEKILILEAMKMQQAVVAPWDGIVESLQVVPGQVVQEGTILAHVAQQL
jgi:3-methylcrotonyl-CoA carboxylase alpha subunit